MSAQPDAFDLLGLAPTLDLDLKTIEQRYRDLQKQLHPDKFTQASAQERRASLSRAVSVNDAYRVLRDDLARAELLYVRLGGRVREEKQPADPELLMEVMDLREELASTKRAGAEVARAKLTADVREKNQHAHAALREAFSKLEAGQDALEDAARALSRLRYYRRFLDEVASIEAEQEDALG